MKRTIEINDHDIIVESLRDFRMYTIGMYIKPEEPFFSEELEAQLVEYYRTEDPSIEAAYKKMIGTAVIKTCYDCPDIPDKYKKNVSQRMVEEVFQCVEASKETYNCLCSRGRYKGLAPGTKSSMQERQKALNELKVVRKAYRTSKLKAIVKRMGKAITTRLAVGGAVLKTTGSTITATIVTTGTILADILVPKSVREKIKEKIVKVKDIVVENVNTALHIAESKLNETPTGQKVVSVVKKAASVVKEIGSEIKDFAIATKNAVVNVAKDAGSYIKKKWKGFKSIFA